MIRAVQLAFSTLTILPVGPIRGEVTGRDVAASRWAYPVVGVVLGGILAGLSLGLSRLGAGLGVSAWALVATLAVLSGGLHLDGLADTFDGLFLGGGAGRRLTVMHDPRVGSHGVVALVLVLLGKVVALQGMGDRARAWAIFEAVALPRCLLLLSVGMARYARPEGTGRTVIDAGGTGDVVVALILIAGVGSVCGPIAAGAAGVVAIGVTLLASRRLGGITGDILGAVVELGELAVLIASPH